MTAATWVLILAVVILGVGILVELEDIVTTLRLMDVACPS